jgi:hypothetical protein
MPKRLNPNLAKMHRNYTVEEVADLFDVHKNSVRAWIKAGLPVCDSRRPVLILGVDLRGYLTAKQLRRKRRCSAEELYCLRCREPRLPAEGMVDYIPMTIESGRLNALCPVCTVVMNRYVRARDLDKIRATLDVRVSTSPERISKSNQLLVNRDFG